jgi:hypothetical protein
MLLDERLRGRRRLAVVILRRRLAEATLAVVLDLHLHDFGHVVRAA